MILESFLKKNEKKNLKISKKKKNLKILNLEEILYLNITEIKKWGFDWNPKIKITKKKISEILTELKNLIQERYILDKFFIIKNYDIKKIRFFCLKKLIKLKNKNFFFEIENSENFENEKNFPKIEKIILYLFVNYIKENDPYYFFPNQNKIFIDENIFDLKKTKNDFFINRNFFNNIFFSGENEIFYEENIQGIFGLLVIMVFHVKKYHFKWLRKFDGAAKSFDLLMNFFY